MAWLGWQGRAGQAGRPEDKTMNKADIAKQRCEDSEEQLAEAKELVKLHQELPGTVRRLEAQLEEARLACETAEPN
jgi:multidrug resistance efflux pump